MKQSFHSENYIYDYYSFGMVMPGRSFVGSVGYRYGMNGQEKDDEVTGNAGATYTAMYWEYDARSGRRWNIDPVVKYWESSYASFANNPIWYSDPFGLDVINAQKADKEKAENKLNAAKEKFAMLKKGDEGYSAAKKELKLIQRAFNRINAKFQRVQSKINEVKQNDPDLFNQADNLLDPAGTEINIYIYDTPEDVMQVEVKDGMVRYGDTDAQPGTQVTSADGSFPDYTTVMSKMHGDNTITIRISDSDLALALHLAHELGHAIYMGMNMQQYLEWLQANPNEQGKGGHGKGDPNGKAAKEAEKKFK